jgi:hypothetical protein
LINFSLREKNTMGITMNKEKMKALAAEIAKDCQSALKIDGAGVGPS